MLHMRGNVTYANDITYAGDVIYAGILHMGAMLHIQAMFTYTGAVTYAGDVTYESFLLLLFLEDNGIVLFCLLTISFGKSIVFDNSDHIKCFLIGTCRPHTATYVGDATYAGFFWSLFLETMELVLFLVY